MLSFGGMSGLDSCLEIVELMHPDQIEKTSLPNDLDEIYKLDPASAALEICIQFAQSVS